MPRFAILTHDHPFLHWDFLLEWGEHARTWRLLEEPGIGSVAAERIADHRLLYLDYEGPVSGGRGHVKQWDQGIFTILEKDRPLEIQLSGRQLKCRARISDTQVEFIADPEHRQTGL